jgi:hypothetical protein
MSDLRTTYTPRVVGVGRDEAVFAVEYPELLFRRGLRNPVIATAPSVAAGPGQAAECRPFELGRAVVAESVNQLLEHGAEPVCVALSAWGFDAVRVADAIEGAIAACREACCTLTPPRVAEAAGAQRGLAACAVGVAERKKVVDSGRVLAGDLVIGIPAGGFLPSCAEGLARPREAFVRAGRPLNREVLQVLRTYRRKQPVHAVAAPGAAYARRPGEGAQNVMALLERKLGPDLKVRVTVDARELAVRCGPFWPARVKDAAGALARGVCGFGLVLVVGRTFAYSIAHALKKRGAAPVILGEVEGLQAPPE